MTVPCEGQLLLLTPPFDDLIPEPIVLGTMQFCQGLMDEHGKQVGHAVTVGQHGLILYQAIFRGA